MSGASSSLKIDFEETLQHENKIVLLWSFTVWLVVMNTTMFNVALPSVLFDLSLSSATASWIVSGYSIVFAISTLTFSRLSDYIPINRLLTIGLTLLGISSIIGLFSEHFYVLLSARLFQAAGAGAVPGLAMVLAGRYIPISRRGKAMSFISSAASLGFGLGPVIGGAITQVFGWNYLFAITCFIFILIPFFMKFLPMEEVRTVQFDAAGAFFTGAVVTGVLLFLSTFSYVILIGSLLSFAYLRKHLRVVNNPFIQPSLLKNKQYMKLLFLGFTAFITHFSALFLMPIMLTVLFEKDPAEVGLIIFPGAILSAFAAQYIGRVIDKFGNAPVVFFGHGFLILATLLFAFLAPFSPYAILFTYMFMSIGFSAFTSSISNEVSRILPKNELGSGMGMAQLNQFFGGAFGVALTGILLSWQKEILPELAYRNIFLGVLVLLVISMITFILYSKKNKEN
ncbi:MFS transporter [Bacillus timonensis]|nr:MFS transporter [Bacillus timonensis]